VDKPTTKQELVALCENAQATQKYDTIYNNSEPLVSSDFRQTTYSTIIDHRFIDVINHNTIKIVLWYDNEWGYSSKVLDIIDLFQRRKHENHSKQF
jgi:glyceraldehyde 3-phosphate dehydrogenase